jgi:hypothetical protein
MNTSQPNNSHDNRLNVIPFKPQSEDEFQAARTIRMMLHYWILRTKLGIDDDSPTMSEGQRKLIKRQGQAIRLHGFRDERDSNLQLAHGMTLFDDEILQQAATKIAYKLPSVENSFRVGDADRACALLSDALTVEEEIITLSVNRALYGIDLEKVSIAA